MGNRFDSDMRSHFSLAQTVRAKESYHCNKVLVLSVQCLVVSCQASDLSLISDQFSSIKPKCSLNPDQERRKEFSRLTAVIR